MNQYNEYHRDFELVLGNEKPAIIVERRKSPAAYHEIIRDAAGWPHLTVVHRPLRASDGLAHPAVIIGKRRFVTNILELLSKRDNLDRKTFQIAMGVQLGYAFEDCVEYSESKLGKSCGCECCGGPTRESRLDDEAQTRRTMYINS